MLQFPKSAIKTSCIIQDVDFSVASYSLGKVVIEVGESLIIDGGV
jgi:hypothetical protein